MLPYAHVSDQTHGSWRGQSQQSTNRLEKVAACMAASFYHVESMTESLSSPAPLRVISRRLLASVSRFATAHSSIWVDQLERGVSGSDQGLGCVLAAHY